MFFTRTHRYTTSLAKEDLRNRLLGKHLVIHNLDFEVLDDEGVLSIIPHAEEIEEIKTLPITYIDFSQDGAVTKVAITSKMRKFDSGGPMILLMFCFFMLAFSIVLYFTSQEHILSYLLMAIGSAILIIFGVRMEMGYFDYVRKIQSYLKNHMETK